MMMPTLRVTPAESEKAVLQCAVAATDQKIDKLAYDLYGLIEEGIVIVSGCT